MTETIIPVKVYVQDNERALLVCPACGLTHELDAAERLSVLVLSDVYGAVVREAPPPKR